MATETVSLKLPSGEVVDAIVPAGLDDAGVKSLVRMKHPDLFGPPAGAAGPHVAMHEHNLVTGNPNPSFDSAPAGATGDLKQAIEGTVKSTLQVSTPGIATSLLKKNAPGLAAKLPAVVTANATPAEQLPGQIITTGLMGMEGGLGEPNRPPGPVPAAAAVKPVASAAQSTLTKALTNMVLKKIPGVHLITDAIQFAKDAGWSEEKAATKTAPQAAPNGWPAPSPELTKASGLMEGGKPAVDPAEGLGKVPSKAAPPEPVAQGFPSKTELQKTLETNLRDALGYKTVRPGIKLRDQLKTDAAITPEGHTEVADSAAVKSYKYDADAKELHVTSKDGTTYVAGEVTPAQAEAFASADSKGTAWQKIRENSTPVAKIINGKRIALKPAQKLHSAAPDDNLQQMLEKSLAAALSGK